MQITILRLVLVFLSSTYPLSGMAYVGPGLGAGALGVIIGVIVSVFLAIFAIVWYPLKRIIKRFRNKGTVSGSGNTNPGEQEPGEDQPENRNRL